MQSSRQISKRGAETNWRDKAEPREVLRSAGGVDKEEGEAAWHYVDPGLQASRTPAASAGPWLGRFPGCLMAVVAVVAI